MLRITFVALFLMLTPALRADGGLEFYERKIRPVIVEHCSKCHSAEVAKAGKLKGGLVLDSKESLLAGGDSGPVIVPGKPKESLLLKTLHYDGDTKMPPKGKLSDAIIADFTKWIEMGAPAPAGTTAKKQVGLTIEEGRRFWAYKPVMAPAIPAVQNASWPRNEIDRFILAGLEAKAMTPAADADKAVLIRRVYFDLTGLPPTPEQVDAFLKDSSPDAFKSIVDTLLASPHFGERWARHWLDIARYADSVTLRGFIFKESWRYRDYVIQSFNDDLPFDRFIREQIAGDLLPATDALQKQRQTIATTFLMLGNTNLEEQDKKMLRMDMVDEQLDVITKGFLGQTVTCARCHDHKFDPIPTKDYYALAGILRNTKSLEHANVSKWTEVPLPTDAETEKLVTANEAKIKALQAKLTEAKKGAKTVKGILPVKDVPGVVVDDAAAKKVGDWKPSTHSESYIGEGYCHDENKGKGEKTLTFQPDLPASGKYEVRLAYSAGTSRADKVPVTVFSADGEKEIAVNMKDAPAIDGRFVSLGVYRFEKTGQSFVIISNEGTKGHVTADCVTFIPTDNGEAAKPAKTDPNSAAAIEAEIKKLQAEGPKRPMAMVPVDEKTIEECAVHIRGSVANLGDIAPRGVLSVVGNSPAFPKDASGRLELANWIADAKNPLTARVIVNRVWHWLFGSGIVRTTDNFGTTGELPSNQALLDHLATRFVAEGWSIKKLIREMVLSRTYQQACVIDAKADPENRLFGRANRKRHDAESLRDAMLWASGTLSQNRGGPGYPASLAADYSFKVNDSRRSVYLPVFRNSLPEILQAFDFADTSVVVGVRNNSTVAPQALFMMNNPFVIEQASLTAKRLMKETANDEERLTRAYRLILGRLPTDGERSIANKYLSKSNTEAAWAAIVHTLLASADYRYLN